ncbi:hypothetical protein NC651_035689 [Populus alba x Populus x berolinensis]|nr:hypothetical protein NC651_035689 [Populus alba x Populus x berolinensis]
MEQGPIIMDGLYIFKDMIHKREITRARIFTTIEAKVSRTFLVGGQTYLTPLEIIMGVTACFKKNIVFTPMVTRALSSFVKAFSAVVVLLFPPSISAVKARTIRPSTQGVHIEVE